MFTSLGASRPCTLVAFNGAKSCVCALSLRSELHLAAWLLVFKLNDINTRVIHKKYQVSESYLIRRDQKRRPYPF